MAGRIRSIKPEILDDEECSALSDEAWRLWVSSWCLADDHGNLRAGDRYLAALVWQDTTRSPRVAAILRELQRAKRLLVYEVRGERYAHVLNWAKHQRIDNAGKPRVPGPDVESTTCAPFRGESPQPAEVRDDSQVSPLDHRPTTTDHDHDHERRPGANAPATPADLTLIPTEAATPTTADNARTVLAALNAARKAAIPGARELRPTTANLAGITARLNDGATVADCLHVIAVRKREVERGGEAQWFDAITPFRPDNFAKSEAMRVEDVRGPVKAKSFTPEPQHRPDTLRRLSDVTHRPDPEAA